MIKVDLKSKKTLVFDTTNTEQIKSASFAIQFPNNVIYTYPGIINVELGTVTVELPILKDLITKEIEGQCYLELQDEDYRYYRVAKDTISFFYGEVVQVNFHSKDYVVDATYRNRDEIVLDSKHLRLTPVGYKEGVKPPTRREVTKSSM